MKSLRETAEGGLPIYAECGGAVYLGKRSIIRAELTPSPASSPWNMDSRRRPRGHGYTVLEAVGENPFFSVGKTFEGMSSTTPTCFLRRPRDLRFAFRVHRGHGFDGQHDGLCRGNVLALYTHIHALGTVDWAPSLVKSGGAVQNEIIGMGSRSSRRRERMSFGDHYDFPGIPERRAGSGGMPERPAGIPQRRAGSTPGGGGVPGGVGGGLPGKIRDHPGPLGPPHPRAGEVRPGRTNRVGRMVHPGGPGLPRSLGPTPPPGPPGDPPGAAHRPPGDAGSGPCWSRTPDDRRPRRRDFIKDVDQDRSRWVEGHVRSGGLGLQQLRPDHQPETHSIESACDTICAAVPNPGTRSPTRWRRRSSHSRPSAEIA